MPANYAAENALGTIGAVCWTIQLIPQIYKSWHTKTTEGLSPYLVLIWAGSGVFLGVYSIVQEFNIPLITQPHIFATLSLVSWCQCQYYGREWSLKKIWIVSIAILATFGGFDVGMVFAIRPSYRSGNTRGVQFFGIMCSVLLAVGLLPQYYEIYKYKEVIGISIPFMLIDCLGGVFSLLSLVFRPEFDIIAAVAYSLVVLDGTMKELGFWEGYLRNHAYVAGDEFTLADCALWPVLGYLVHRGLDLEGEEWVGLSAYVDRINARPAESEAKPVGWSRKGKVSLFTRAATLKRLRAN